VDTDWETRQVNVNGDNVRSYLLGVLRAVAAVSSGSKEDLSSLAVALSLLMQVPGLKATDVTSVVLLLNDIAAGTTSLAAVQDWHSTALVKSAGNVALLLNTHAAALVSEFTALRTSLRRQSEKAEAELARELRAFEQKVGAAVAAAEALAEVRMQAARDAFGSLEADLLERARGASAAAALEVEARRAAEQLREAAETQLAAARREAALAAAEAAKAAEALRTERSTRAKAQESITEMQRMTRDATRAAERAVLAESGLREEAAGLRRRLAEAMAALAAAKRAQPPP
jgi:hypothetical protein